VTSTAPETRDARSLRPQDHRARATQPPTLPADLAVHPRVAMQIRHAQFSLTTTIPLTARLLARPTATSRQISRERASADSEGNR
jgi:hypothetical protein